MTTPEQDVGRWVDRVVVGLGLCPFAKPALPGLRLARCDADHVVHTVLDEALALDAAPAEHPATTLVVVVPGLEDFDAFLDAADLATHVLDQVGLTGRVQIATFHPDYRFEGEDPDDPGQWTNRAPWPVLHLIREADITAAVAAHPDTLAVPERNRALLRRLGAAHLRALRDGP